MVAAMRLSSLPGRLPSYAPEPTWQERCAASLPPAPDLPPTVRLRDLMEVRRATRDGVRRVTLHVQRGPRPSDPGGREVWHRAGDGPWQRG